MNLQKLGGSSSINGYISKSQLADLARQNTRESKRLLESCLGFNAVLRGAENINPDRVAREMQDKFCINTEFGNDPVFAALSALTANIFHALRLAQPTNVLQKDLKNTRYSNCIGICATNSYDDELYRKFGKDFPLRSVIMNSMEDWTELQNKMLKLKSVNHSSSGHFLAPFVHEFVHSAHLDNLMKRFGDGTKIMRKFQKDFKNEDTIQFIRKETSNYGATKPCEMVAEEMTELIVNSLNPRTLRPNEMFFQMQRANEPFQMDVLIDACWNGDVKQIEAFRKRKNQFIERLKDIF